MEDKHTLRKDFFNKLRDKVKNSTISLKELNELEEELLFIENGFRAYKGDFVTLVLENGNKIIYILESNFEYRGNGTPLSFYLYYNQGEKRLWPYYGSTLGKIGQNFYYRMSSSEEKDIIMRAIVKRLNPNGTD